MKKNLKAIAFAAAALFVFGSLFSACADGSDDSSPKKETTNSSNTGGGNTDNGNSSSSENGGNNGGNSGNIVTSPFEGSQWDNATEFKVLAATIDGAALKITVDASDLELKWAENVEKVSPTVKLSEGTVSADPGAFFTLAVGSVDSETGSLKNFVLQITLTTPVTNTTVKAVATIKGTTYKTTVSFVNGQSIPSDYVASKIILDKTEVELACGASTTFTAKDGKYGIEQEVTWTLEDDNTDSEISTGGKFTAATVAENATVTVVAKLKANEEVSAKATVTINPEKADVSAVYAVKLYNTENNGAWFHGEISWEDAAYKVVEISSKSAEIQNIQNVTSADGKTTFQIILTSADFRGTTKTLVFRVKTENGAYYDVSVTYKDEDVTASGSTTTVTNVSIEEATLNPKLSLDEKSVQVREESEISVTIVSDDIDTSKITATSSSDTNATATIEGGKLKIKGVAKGSATITIAYKDDEVDLSANLEVTVLGKDEKIVIDWNSLTWVGNGSGDDKNTDKYKVYSNVKSVVNIQKPGWENVSEAGIYIECNAGINNCSLGTDKSEYYIQGAGILVYLKNFTAKETEFTITDAQDSYNVTVYFADGTDSGDGE